MAVFWKPCCCPRGIFAAWTAETDAFPSFCSTAVSCAKAFEAKRVRLSNRPRTMAVPFLLNFNIECVFLLYLHKSLSICCRFLRCCIAIYVYTCTEQTGQANEGTLPTLHASILARHRLRVREIIFLTGILWAGQSCFWHTFPTMLYASSSILKRIVREPAPVRPHFLKRILGKNERSKSFYTWGKSPDFSLRRTCHSAG